MIMGGLHSADSLKPYKAWHCDQKAHPNTTLHHVTQNPLYNGPLNFLIILIAHKTDNPQEIQMAEAERVIWMQTRIVGLHDVGLRR